MSSEGPYRVHKHTLARSWFVTGPGVDENGFDRENADLFCAWLNSAYLSGQRDERERCAKVAEEMKNGFTVDPVEGKMVRDKDGPWFLKSAIAAAIRVGGKAE